MTLAVAKTRYLQIGATRGWAVPLPPQLSLHYLQKPKRPVNDGGALDPAYCKTTPNLSSLDFGMLLLYTDLRSKALYTKDPDDASRAQWPLSSGVHS